VGSADDRQGASDGAREALASVGQRLLWFLDRNRTGGIALNCPVVCALDGPLDIGRLEAALQALVRRHEALRTRIERRGRQLWQSVATNPPTALRVVDLTHVREPEQAGRQALEEELRTRIDPNGMPLRATLWCLAPQRHLFCLNVHHVASDAWSGALQARELRGLYEQAAGRGQPLPPVPVQYIDFAARQAAYCASAAFTRDVEYWSRCLAGADFGAVPLTAPSAPGERETARLRLAIDGVDTHRLSAWARRERGSLFGLLLALYFRALHELTGRDDVTVASLFANRLRPDLQHTVGFLANLVPLRSRWRPGGTFASLHASVAAELREAFVHQACPLHLLPAQLTARDGRRADEAVFQMLPQPFEREPFGEAQLALLAPEAIESRFDFEVTVLMQQSALALIVFWNRRRLRDEWVADFAAAFRAGVNSLPDERGAAPRT
jgi:hypothetical protein